MKLPLISVVLLIMFTSVVYAVPPSFDNHQFYGTVKWDVNITAPSKVSAVSGLISAESAIKSVNCTSECTGTYGLDTDNILRITEAKDGDVIKFYIGTLNPINYTYKAGSVTLLDLNIVTPKPAPKVNDTKPESKTNATINVTANVTTNVTVNISTNATTASTPVVVLGSCTQQWSCSSWKACLNNVQTRSCYRIDDCDVQLEEGLIASIIEVPKLPESQGCVSPIKASPPPETPLPPKPAANCTDKIKNQDETGIDCGGACKACVKPGSMLRYYVSGAVGVAIIVVLLLLFLRREPKIDEQTISRLRSAYSSGESRGMSDEQITKKLIESGWDEKILKAFLKQK